MSKTRCKDHRARLALAAGAVAVVLEVAASGNSMAETSSWSQRAPAAPQTGSVSRPRVTPQSRQSAPQASANRRRAANRSPIQGPLPGLEKKLGPLSASPSGKNAAYMAFEMGLYTQAARLAQQEVGNNSPQAHTLLGVLHANGLGVAKDPAQAAKWYAKAAELGDVEGIFAYGVALAAGNGVKKDPAQAAAYFERAARQGHAYAHYNLALAFLSGAGKPENPARAAAHLNYAAENGIARAQYDLAALYRTGTGVSADAYLASLWLSRAANGGLTEAEYEYAVALLKGEGLNRDKPNIVKYLTAAANKGVTGAQNRLAHLYFEGALVARDPVAGATWRLIAKQNGSEDAALDRIVAGLPAKTRAQAERAADAYLAEAAVGIIQRNG